MYANISNKTRKAVYRRDDYACALCDSTKGLQVHHVIPRGKGGIDSEQNLITLCCFCHAAVHGQPIDVTEMTAADYEQACIEYLADYYAPDWNPWKKE